MWNNPDNIMIEQKENPKNVIVIVSIDIFYE
jgi:hypothetical protein